MMYVMSVLGCMPKGLQNPFVTSFALDDRYVSYSLNKLVIDYETLFYITKVLDLATGPTFSFGLTMYLVGMIRVQPLFMN